MFQILSSVFSVFRLLLGIHVVLHAPSRSSALRENHPWGGSNNPRIYPYSCDRPKFFTYKHDPFIKFISANNINITDNNVLDDDIKAGETTR